MYARLDVDIHYDNSEWLQIVEPDGTVHEVRSASVRFSGGLPYVDVVENEEGRTWTLVSYNDNTWTEVV
jgi:hypothetical protein